MNAFRLEVREAGWGGSVGTWRPAITGTLNQTGKSDAEASTLDTRGDAEGALALCIAEGGSAENFRIVEVTTFTMRDGEGGDSVCTSDNIDDAKGEACEWAKGGDYGEITSTTWVDVYIDDDNGDCVTSLVVAIDPPEPDCTHDDGHDWQSPHDLVGGLKENPGVWGHGGGVIILEACLHCGCKRTRDTWAQRPDTGEQGLESVTYEPEAYSADELAALEVES